MTKGILAVWNDCAAGHVAEYEEWYQTEHLPERLSVPGIQRARRYASVGGPPNYFTYYDVTGPDVLLGDAYLDKVNNPTPETRRIMAGIFLNMSRTVCEVVHRRGVMRGAFAVTCQIAPDQMTGILDMLDLNAAIVRIEGWRACDEAIGIDNAERDIRGHDDQIEACVLIETLREGPARALARQLADFGHTRVYALLCDMAKDG